MKAQLNQQYNASQQFEPLLPVGSAVEPLLERASDLTRAATKLGATVGPVAQAELRTLLRSMNSYYTNRIEGEHTRPSDIDRALKQDFSGDRSLARRQRLAIAHIHAEEICEVDVDRRSVGGQDATRWLYTTEALTRLHRELFGGLPAEDLQLIDGSSLAPGEIRSRAVSVGRHEAPAAEALPAFLARWAEVYGSARRGEASIVAMAAAHHRLAWTHPFLDGNGRVMRLHSHLVLRSLGLTGGLWSPLRGFARTEARYKALLQAADEHRQGDLDGRGNLTQSGLVDWIQYVIEVCIDQIEFMTSQLNVQAMRDRIQAALTYEADVTKQGIRPEALMPLHYLFATQASLGRADFKAMTGLGDRVATSALSALLRRGFLAADSPYGQVRFAVPKHALRFYFPALWPEAEQEEAQIEAERASAYGGDKRSAT